MSLEQAFEEGAVPHHDNRALRSLLPRRGALLSLQAAAAGARQPSADARRRSPAASRRSPAVSRRSPPLASRHPTLAAARQPSADARQGSPAVSRRSPGLASRTAPGWISGAPGAFSPSFSRGRSSSKGETASTCSAKSPKCAGRRASAACMQGASGRAPSISCPSCPFQAGPWCRV